jgi:OOP family OmpA-OmpF porin
MGAGTLNQRKKTNTMICKHTRRPIALAALAALGTWAAAPALAQSENYFYGGISAGQSRAKIDENRVAATVLGAGVAATVTERDERDKAYKIFGGYQFNRYFGLEAGYFDLGRSSFRATTVPPGTLDGNMRFRGYNLDAVGTWPIGEQFSLIGRVGGAFARTRGSFNGTGAATVANPAPTDRQTNPKVGIGLQYAFTPGFMMRAEAERYGVSNGLGNRDRVSTYTVSLVMPFGRGSAAPRMAEAPRYVAEAPPPVVVAPAPMPAPPPPVVVVQAPPPPPPAPPAPMRVSFSAESLFGFDRSALRPEGKTALDDFARQLQGTSYETITVVGHTDRLGTEAYNQTLSQQRADIVKEHLVATDGLRSARISAVGKGEAEPVTKPEDCKGSKANATLIACLQPDRRVEVEVSGTR